MLTAATWAIDHPRLDARKPRPLRPGRCRSRRVHRPVRHRPAHPARRHGRPGRDAPGVRPRDERHDRRRRRRASTGWSVGDARHRDAARLGRDLPRLPGRQHAHLPEPGLHRHRLPRRAAGALERARRARSSRCPPDSRCDARRARRAGRGGRARRAPLRARAGREGRRHRRRPDRRAHRHRRPRTSAPRSS